MSASSNAEGERDLSGSELGEFVLVEKIGQGGYGAVYRARQPALQRDVVVKVLRKADDIAEQRFLREAQLASRFEHPFAAHIYAFGIESDEDRWWIAMELVQGITLAAWLARNGPMPLEQFVPFFECVADAVDAAHQSGIIHRDLKPSNMMVIERGGRLTPKLLDFGIAKLVEGRAGEPLMSVGELRAHASRSEKPTAAEPRSSGANDAQLTVTAEYTDGRGGILQGGLTRTGFWFGSLPYMSPEQWRDPKTVDAASDIYSLGIIAYEVLNGDLPFKAATSDEYSRLHRDAEIPSLADRFPERVQQTISCALAKLRIDRYRSALAMAADLREALHSQPHEQLRSLAKVWNEQSRPPALLLHGSELLRTTTEASGELERAYLAASQRRTVRISWLRRLLVVAVVAVAAMWYRGALKGETARQVVELEARAARQVADATATQSALEQGRSALLHNEPDAHVHLFEAYRRDPLPSTAFMLARSLQSRLAEQARVEATGGRMRWVEFSPDGRMLVAADDHNAQIWDTTRQRLLVSLPHNDIVYQAIFSSDGTKVFTACNDGAVRIWDARNGSLLRRLAARGIQRRYSVLARSSDDRMIASTGYEDTPTHVWDAASGVLLAELHQVPGDWPGLAFSPDGRWLAIANRNGYVFDTRSWKEVVMMPNASAIQWDPKGSRLLAGGQDGRVSLWSIPKGERLHFLQAGDRWLPVAFSPDGRLVASGETNGTLRVWDASTGELVTVANRLQSKIIYIEFERSSKLIVVSSVSGSAAVYEARSGVLVTTLSGPRSTSPVARFDPSSRRVAVASFDGTARIWDVSPPVRSWISPRVAVDCQFVTSLESDRRFVAVPCEGHPARIWDTEQGQLLAELPNVTPTGGNFVSAYPAVSAAGDRAAIARGKTLEVYELPGGRMLHKLEHDAPVNTAAFSPFGRDLVSGTIDGELRVTRDGGVVVSLPKSADGIDAAGFLPDGRIVAADASFRLRIFTAHGVVLAELKTGARVRMLRMKDDGDRLLTVPTFMRGFNAAELWDVVRYRRVAQLNAGSQIVTARFIGDNVFSSWIDSAVRVWGSSDGNLRQVYRDGTLFFSDATLSADGAMVIGGGADGFLRFWDAGSGRLLWRMLAHDRPVVAVRVDGNAIVTRGFSGEFSRWTLPESNAVIEECLRREQCAASLKP